MSSIATNTLVKAVLSSVLFIYAPTTKGAITSCWSYHATSSCGDEACGMKCSDQTYYAMDCGADIFDGGFDIEHTESCGAGIFVDNMVLMEAAHKAAQLPSAGAVNPPTRPLRNSREYWHW